MSVEDIHRLEQQYQSSPDDPEALLKLAQAYEQERLLGQALLAYAKALEFEWGPKAWVDFHIRFFSHTQESLQRTATH